MMVHGSCDGRKEVDAPVGVVKSDARFLLSFVECLWSLLCTVVLFMIMAFYGTVVQWVDRSESDLEVVFKVFVVHFVVVVFLWMLKKVLIMVVVPWIVRLDGPSVVLKFVVVFLVVVVLSWTVWLMAYRMVVQSVVRSELCVVS